MSNCLIIALAILATSIPALAFAVGTFFTWRGHIIAKKALEMTEENSDRAFRMQIIDSCFKEYRTPEMGRAVFDLWHLFRDECHGNKKEWIEKYIDMWKVEANKKTHFEIRRPVSTFFQQLALLAKDDEFIEKEIYKVWGGLGIIAKILLPIETVAIPKTMGNKPSKKKELPDQFGAMLKLYMGSPGRKALEKKRLKDSSEQKGQTNR